MAPDEQSLQSNPTEGRSLQLEAHIEAARIEGLAIDSGQFSVDPKVALRKLGSSQLGQPGAWALKVIQAIVASNSEAPIEVYQGRTDIQIAFQSGRIWSVDEVLESLERLDIEVADDLVHLRYGLLSAIHFEDLDVHLGFAEAGLSLFWDGEHWRQKPWSSASASVLRVATKSAPRRDETSWVKRRVQSSATHIDLSRILTIHCHTCPLPLSVDGRRIDALQNFSKHRSGVDTFALDLWTVKSSGLPTLRLPPFSYSPKVGKLITKNRLRGSFPVLERTHAEGASLAYTLLYHVSRTSGYVSESKPDNPAGGTSVIHWVKDVLRTSGCVGEPKPAGGSSAIHWIKDGVVVQIDEIKMATSTSCSLALFVSAQGLPDDASSLRLRESQERASRTARALRDSSSVLEKRIGDLGGVSTHDSRLALGFSLGFSGIGVPTCFVNPILGSALVTIGAAFKFVSSQITNDLNLAQDLRSFTDHLADGQVGDDEDASERRENTEDPKGRGD